MLFQVITSILLGCITAGILFSRFSTPHPLRLTIALILAASSSLIILDWYELNNNFSTSNKLVLLVDENVLSSFSEYGTNQWRTEQPTQTIQLAYETNTLDQLPYDHIIIVRPEELPFTKITDFGEVTLSREETLAILRSQQAKQAYANLLSLRGYDKTIALQLINTRYPSNDIIKEAIFTHLYNHYRSNTTLANELSTHTMIPFRPSVSILKTIRGEQWAS